MAFDKKPNQLKHILVIRLSAMGDVAITIPVIRAFIQQYPNVKITVLTRSFFTPFFRNLERVSVFSVDVKGKHKGVLGLYKLSKELKREGIDVVADLHNVLRSSILKWFMLGKTFIQVDKSRSEKKALIQGKCFKQLKTTHQRYADVFEKLGFKIDLSNPVFPKKIILSDKIRSIVGVKTKKWIGIAPFAQYESKMYPLDLMEKVIESLSKDYDIFLFGGGENEMKFLKLFEKKLENTTNLAGRLSLDEELDVISNLDLMLSMDSGNAHIAAMLGVKVVTIWGLTHPYSGFYPFNQDKENALLVDKNQYPKIPTSIYGNKYPENYKDAIRTITPESVVSKITSILK